MRNAPNMRVEKFRVREGELGSDSSLGNNGVFILCMKRMENPFSTGSLSNVDKVSLFVVVSDEEWEHVSVQVDINPPRLPTWEEMCYVKNMFWKEDETVVQFHPKKSEYVNCHPFVLHLWKPIGKEIELPPSWMVGPKEEKVSNDR